jgi:hypothetical protein
MCAVSMLSYCISLVLALSWLVNGARFVYLVQLFDLFYAMAQVGDRPGCLFAMPNARFSLVIYARGMHNI